jgi:phosphatidylserine decarboxylase
MTRYGTDVFLGSLAILLAAVCAVFFFSPWMFVNYSVLTFAAILAGLVINFFRDPERTAPVGDDIVISPADGKIVVIQEIMEPEYIGGKATQISIFMSPLDVHVNRIPVDGTVRLLRHVPGKFIAAFEDKASDLNERMLIGIERRNGTKLFFKQIAGAVARRIVADLAVGQEVRAGERFGMIKFGSRVDIYLSGDVTVNVTLHQRVTAGESLLATYR